MSHWDFSRRPREEHGAPPGPADTLYEPAYEPDLMPGPGDVRAAQETCLANMVRPGQGDGWPGEVAAAEKPGPEEDPWPADAPWPAGGRWADSQGWRAQADDSPGQDSPAAGQGWAGGEGRPPQAVGSPGEGWPPGDAWDEEAEEAPYPITYERDDFLATDSDPDPQPVAETGPPPASPGGPWPRAPYPGFLGAIAAPGDRDAGSWPGDGDSRPRAAGWRAGRGGRHWLVLAGVVVAGGAVGAAAVLLAGRSPDGGAGRGGQAAGTPGAPHATPAGRASAPSPSATAAAPLTLAQAKEVLARYTATNNNANAQRSDALLATVETGSSYAIDAGLYQAQQGTAPYPAFAPARATYYIPRDEPASGPRWFVVQVANAFSSNPQKVTSMEYLLFSQTAAGGPWQNAVEPYLLSGASAPQIAVGTDGLATAVGPDAASVAVAPARLAAVTASSADGTAPGHGQPAIAVPGNLADVNDQQFWQGKVPGGRVTDAHTPATGTAGQEFALQTTGGGALVFYTDAAQVTITPPAGAALHLTIPGFYSPGQALPAAGLTYLEQFATYDPPAGGKAPTVVADYSGITGKD